MSHKELINIAKAAAEYAYAPYSEFYVGAALLTENGKIFTGCNIENAAFSPTICAERVAFAKALSEGERHFKAIAITTSIDSNCPPCGVCRQVMREFCKDDFQIILKDKEFTLKELLPESFSKEEIC